MILSIFCLATTESLTNQTQTRLIHINAYRKFNKKTVKPSGQDKFFDYFI